MERNWTIPIFACAVVAIGAEVALYVTTPNKVSSKAPLAKAVATQNLSSATANSKTNSGIKSVNQFDVSQIKSYFVHSDLTSNEKDALEDALDYTEPYSQSSMNENVTNSSYPGSPDMVQTLSMAINDDLEQTSNGEIETAKVDANASGSVLKGNFAVKDGALYKQTQNGWVVDTSESPSEQSLLLPMQTQNELSTFFPDPQHITVQKTPNGFIFNDYGVVSFNQQLGREFNSMLSAGYTSSDIQKVEYNSYENSKGELVTVVQKQPDGHYQVVRSVQISQDTITLPESPQNMTLDRLFHYDSSLTEDFSYAKKPVTLPSSL